MHNCYTLKSEDIFSSLIISLWSLKNLKKKNKMKMSWSNFDPSGLTKNTKKVFPPFSPKKGGKHGFSPFYPFFPLLGGKRSGRFFPANPEFHGPTFIGLFFKPG